MKYQINNKLGWVLASYCLVSVHTADAQAVVSYGELHATDLGIARGYEDIAGHATMVKNNNGTKVNLHITGLMPYLVYTAHVHNAPCSLGGGGHYQHDINGIPAPPNELWPSSDKNVPGMEANPSGNSNGKADSDWIARPEAQSIVVHDPTDKARIACLDLE